MAFIFQPVIVQKLKLTNHILERVHTKYGKYLGITFLLFCKTLLIALLLQAPTPSCNVYSIKLHLLKLIHALQLSIFSLKQTINMHFRIRFGLMKSIDT